ncbi:MAG: hypothetical protein Q4C54_09215 [Clostridia bacterium]|nr:hypothetical protein [Clostridia bacterium]
MSEIKTNEKHGLWQNAMKLVKGTSTEQLMEDFTAEMTLVAEGLCEDQSTLRREVDGLRRELDEQVQSLRSEVQVQETSARENQRDLDRRLDDISARLTALEKAVKTQKDEKSSKDTKLSVILTRATWLVGILAGSWIIVTILNMIK